MARYLGIVQDQRQWIRELLQEIDRLIVGKVQERFGLNATSQEVWKELNQGSFVPYVEVLSELGITTSSQIETYVKNNASDFQGKSIASARHSLKKQYRPALMDKLNRPAATQLQTKYPNEDWANNRERAYRSAQFQEFFRLTQKLGPADSGNIAEDWAEEFTGDKGARHVLISPEEMKSEWGIELAAKRFADFIVGNQIIEQKYIKGKLENNPHDAEQYRDYEKILRRIQDSKKPVTITESDGTKHEIEEIKYRFLNPIGVLKNADWMEEQLGNYNNFVAEIFNFRGEIKKIRQRDTEDRELLQDPAKLEEWLELPPPDDSSFWMPDWLSDENFRLASAPPAPGDFFGKNALSPRFDSIPQGFPSLSPAIGELEPLVVGAPLGLPSPLGHHSPLGTGSSSLLTTAEMTKGLGTPMASLPTSESQEAALALDKIVSPSQNGWTAIPAATEELESVVADAPLDLLPPLGHHSSLGKNSSMLTVFGMTQELGNPTTSPPNSGNQKTAPAAESAAYPLPTIETATPAQEPTDLSTATGRLESAGADWLSPLGHRSPLGANSSLLKTFGMTKELGNPTTSPPNSGNQGTAPAAESAAYPLPNIKTATPAQQEPTNASTAVPPSVKPFPSSWNSLRDFWQQSSENVAAQSPWASILDSLQPSSEGVAAKPNLSSSANNDKQTSFPTPDDSNSTLSKKTEKENSIDTPDEETELDPQQLEMLAQLVYLRVRALIELEQERCHNITPSAPSWLDISSPSTSGKAKIELDIGTPLLSRELDALAREVYRELQWRLKTETEREGYRY